MPEADNTTFKRAPLRDHPRLVRRRIIDSWPFFVWLGLVVLAAYLYTRSVQFGQLTGVVWTVAEPVAPLQTARLKSIKVQLGDRVKAGQLVAEMDTTLVDVQLALAEATMAQAQGTLATYEGQMHDLVRTFDTAIKDAETKLGEQKSLQESDGARLKELKRIQATQEELFKKQLIPESQLNALKPDIVALEKTMAAYPALITTYERMLVDSRRERENLQVSMKVEKGADIMQAIDLKAKARGDVFETALGLRNIQKESYNLRPTRDGIVSQILQVPGDVISSGTPILKIVSEHSDEIEGYLPELHLSSLRIGDTAYAFRAYGNSPIFKLKVESISPEISSMPTGTAPISTISGMSAPVGGRGIRIRRVMFKIEGPHDLIPGETVQIRATSPLWVRISSWFGR
jgi:multidrug resistance efflux pump